MVAVLSRAFEQPGWIDLQVDDVYEVVEWQSFYQGAALVREYIRNSSSSSSSSSSGGGGKQEGFAFHTDLGNMPPAPSAS